MSNYLKPQSPLKHGEDYIYPITTADQVVMEDGSRLNGELSKHLKVDMKNANEAEPNGINADSLGGYSADEYLRKDQSLIQVNYSVVNNLTKPKDESMFTQNMIWIDTDVDIGRVFFGDNKPNETFIDGDVWVYTGNNSSVAFNALRIGNDYVNMVYPLSAKQMGNDGALVDVTAKSWQDGKWVDWATYLLDRADLCESITGGWNTRCHTNSSYSLGTATFGNNGVTLQAVNGKAVCVSTNNKINLSGKSIFYIVVSNATITNQYDFALYLSTSPLASVNSNGNQAAKIIIRPGENIIEIPDGLSGGEYYVSIGMHIYNQGTQTATIKQVSFEMRCE